MVYIKKANQIELMRKAGKILADAFVIIKPYLQDGVSTGEINEILEEYLRSNNAIPAFKGYKGFPAASCISINDVVVHGIPSFETFIKNGDIVGIDIGAILDGWHADAARTYAIGKVSGRNANLIEDTEQCFFKGIEVLRDGAHTGDIGAAIQSYAHSKGHGVVRALSGHGIGLKLHEDPFVPNFGVSGQGFKLKTGMAIAIEPMINLGTYDVTVDNDGWTIRTKDGQNSAHYENTVIITEDGVDILTI